MAAVKTDVISGVAEMIITALGDSLYSLILYGSAVRGGFERQVSDINVLLVLSESDAQSHEKLRAALKDMPRVEPLIIGLKELERTMQTFGLKFLSIRRSYLLLHGADVLSGFTLPPELHRQLAEEALRNLQLRLTRAYVRLSPDHKPYTTYLLRSASGVIVNISEVLRMRGVELPLEFPARLPVLQQHFGPQTEVLNELLKLRHNPRKLTTEEERSFHERLFALITHAIRELEKA